MSITTEVVTPKIAEQWLNLNTGNRKLRDGVAEKYANDMRNGNWTACVAPIVFYEDGQLADGQHRLWGVVDSGTVQSFIIVRGLSRAAGLNIDVGSTRTLVDNARISGNGDISNTLLIAARAMSAAGTTGTNQSHAEKLAMVERYRPHAAFATSHVRRIKGLCGGAILGAVGRAHMHEPDTERLKRFCAVLATGLYDDDGDTAAIALRNYMLTKGAVVNTTSMWRDTFLKAQNAVHHFMRRKRLTVLKAVETDIYPLIEPEPSTKKPARKKPAKKGTQA